MELDQGIVPEPESFEILFESNAQIIVFSGADSYFHLRHKLGLEFDDVPLKNPSLAHDTSGQQDLTQEITLIYITGFFTDNIDFALYVKGLENMTALSKGTIGSKCYNGPCFATPVVRMSKEVQSALMSGAIEHFFGEEIGFDQDEIFKDSVVKASRLEFVSRTETKGLRWRYYYETACAAYEKLEFDWDKFKEQKSRRTDETGERASVPPENKSLSDTPSQSATPPEDYALTPTDEMEAVEEYEKEDENDVSVEVKEVEDEDTEMDRGMEGLEIESDVD